MRKIYFILIVALFISACSVRSQTLAEKENMIVDNDTVSPDNGDTDNKAQPDADIKTGNSTWFKITAGGNHTCGIKTDQKLYCWGNNERGELGDGTSGYDCHDKPDYPGNCANKNVPTKIGDDIWLEITVKGEEFGVGNTCGIKTDQKLYCWGWNYYGQLGDGTTESRITPTKIGNDSWSAITLGSRITCGIKTDNSLYCWGYNVNGELGDGTSGYDCQDSNGFPGNCANKNSPTKIGDGTWIRIAEGYNYTCGIKTDNRLYCWGKNEFGQLGDGTTESKITPIKIGDDVWLEITAGGDHTCGIKAADNRLYCWGHNSDGQLGNGKDGAICHAPYICSDKNTPTQISNDADTWSEISAGYLHTCGIKTDGKLYCWGDNKFGELANGTLGLGTSKNTPTQIGNDTWFKIAAGDFYTCGIKTDNRLYCWGKNEFGQLGDGTTYNKTAPTLVVDP